MTSFSIAVCRSLRAPSCSNYLQKRPFFIFCSLLERDHLTLWHWCILSFWRPRARPQLVYFLTVVKLSHPLGLVFKVATLPPILVFLMHDEHPVTRAMVQADDWSQEKLRAFKEKASNGRIRATFKSSDDLRGLIIQS